MSPAMAQPAGPTGGRWIGFAAAAAVLAVAVVLSLHPIATTDFFWQLRAGDWIRQEGSVPRTDPFSYTAAGRPWIDLHWGFQVAVSILHGWFGPDGLTVARVLLVGATAALLLFGFSRGRITTVGLWAVLGALLASHERFLVRPEIVSFLLLAVLLILLEGGIRNAADPWSYLPIALLVVWVNVHSLFILGVAVLALAAAGEGLDLARQRRLPLRPDRVRPADRKSLQALVAVTAAAALACLLNPFGWRAFSLPLLQFTDRIAAGNPYSGSIAEFQQPFDAGFGTFAVGAFWLLAITVGAVLLLRGRRLPSRQVLVAAAFFLLAWRARRNLPLFAIAAVPVLIEGGRALVRTGWPPRWRRPAVALARITVLAAALVITVTVVTDRFYTWERMDRRFGSGVLAGLAPYGAADFVAGRLLSGRLFHTLDDGGYLLWRFHPERQVFIDGRLEVYDESTFTEYLQALEDPGRFETVAARDGIRNVLWNHSKALIGQRLLRHLMQSPDWKPVYIDSVAILFRRAGPDPAAGEPEQIDLELESPAAVLARGSPPRTRLDRFLTDWIPGRRQSFLPAVRLGIVHALLGVPRQAEAFLLRATAGAGVAAEVRSNLGLVYDRMGLSEKAILEYEEARRASSAFRDPLGSVFRRGFRQDLLLRLGSAYIKAGMEDRGVPILERAGRPGRARLLAMEGYRLQQEGDALAAVDRYRDALRFEPGSPEILHNLGLALIAAAVAGLDAGQSPEPLVMEAATAFRQAIEASPGFASAHFNLGLLLIQDGRPLEAAASFEQAAALDPENPGFRYQQGFALLQAGRSREASAALSAAVRLQPEFPQAHFQLGLALQGVGDLAGAQQAFRASYDQGMTDARVTLQLARLHALRGEPDAALDWLRRTGMTPEALRGILPAMPELAPLIERLGSEAVSPPA